MRRILYLGGKTFEISTLGDSEGRVELVERDLGVQRRLALSVFEAGWLGGLLSRISSWYHGGLYASLKGGSRCLEITRNQNGKRGVCGNSGVYDNDKG